MCSEKIVLKERKNCLPGVALAISIFPVLLHLFLHRMAMVDNFDSIRLLDSLQVLCEAIIQHSLNGVLFYIAGIVIGIVALCKNAHRTVKSGRMLSIIAIVLSSFFLGLIFLVRYLMTIGSLH